MVESWGKVDMRWWDAHKVVLEEEMVGSFGWSSANSWSSCDLTYGIIDTEESCVQRNGHGLGHHGHCGHDLRENLWTIEVLADSNHQRLDFDHNSQHVLETPPNSSSAMLVRGKTCEPRAVPWFQLPSTDPHVCWQRWQTCCILLINRRGSRQCAQNRRSCIQWRPRH